MPIAVADYLATYTGRMLNTAAEFIADLTPEELHYRLHDNTNSIGFEAWHVARTADNIVNFAFERKPPVWLEQNLFEQWNLPKVDQGTGMAPEEAHALRFPEAGKLAQYCRDVGASVVPQIRAMSDDYLEQSMTIRPQGEMRKVDILAQVVLNHGNNHVGAANVALTALGKPGMGF